MGEQKTNPLKTILGIIVIVLLLIVGTFLHYSLPRLPLETIPDYCKRTTESIFTVNIAGYEECVNREARK